jgi:ketosteroid isomerase-like protein
MSEQTNTATLQSVYAAFNSGDIQGVLANVDSNAKWVNYGPSPIPYCGEFSGRIPDFFAAIGATTTGGNVAIDRYIASGDIVVTQGRYTATVRGTAAKLDSPIAHNFTFRNGKITSWTGYSDTAAILAAHTGKSVSA